MKKFILVSASILLSFTTIAESTSLEGNSDDQKSERKLETPQMIDAVAQHDEATKKGKVQVNNIEISDRWIRMPTATSKNTAAYFNISNNTDKDIKITDVRTVEKLAERIEIHGYKPDDDGVKKMFKLSSVTIPANSTIEFKPGSFHVMLMGLKDQIDKGTTYEFKFKIRTASEDSKKVNKLPDHVVSFPVR